jgi:autotransporter-associated beta strand protein
MRSLTFNNTADIFTISGSPLAITNAAGITNNDADTQTINSNIVLGATQTWTAASGNLVVAGNISPSAAVDLFVVGASNTTLSGALSGTLGINKFAFETGTLTLSGASANTYTRDTAISGGTVVLSKTAGVNAIPGGTLTVGDFAGVANDDVLRLGASNQIADDTNIAIDSAGLFDLNGFNETISGTRTMSGGKITTGVGYFAGSGRRRQPMSSLGGER